MSRRPDFLIIGAAKCGTTSLYAYLARHSRIYMCTPKEPEFFSDDSIYANGLEWYQTLFRFAREDQIAGEASTTYTRWPHTADAARRVADILPAAKLIYIVRHPVERAFSHYAHHMRLGVTMTFEEALEESSVYVDCSMYMDQLDRYRSRFDDERLLVLLLDDMNRQPRETLDQVQRFLDLDRQELAAPPLVANRGGSDHLIRARTTGRVRALPGVGNVVEKAPQSWRDAGYQLARRSFIGRRIDRDFHLPPMRPDTRRQLVEHFAEQTSELSSFLGRDLSSWTR